MRHQPRVVPVSPNHISQYINIETLPIKYLISAQPPTNKVEGHRSAHKWTYCTRLFKFFIINRPVFFYILLQALYHVQENCYSASPLHIGKSIGIIGPNGIPSTKVVHKAPILSRTSPLLFFKIDSNEPDSRQ